VKVAVATGAAVGGGLELLLMCDHRIVAEGVALGFPEIRMGVYPAGGSVPSLVAAVGRSRALRMLLGGELMSSERALECGLVDEVLPAEQVRSRALELAAELSAAGASTAVLRAIRRELSPGISVKEIPDVMRELLGGMSGTELADRVHAQRTKLGGTRTPGPDNLPGDR
jgi:enoyl-CoA hydratase